MISLHWLLLVLAYDYHSDMLFLYVCDGDDRVLSTISDKYIIEVISNVNDARMIKDAVIDSL